MSFKTKSPKLKKKVKVVASRVFDIAPPKLVKKTPKQNETEAIHAPYVRPKLEVYLNH